MPATLPSPFLEHGAFRTHRDDFRCRAYFESKIDCDAIIHLDDDAVAKHLSKARGAYHDLILAGQQKRSDVVSLGVRLNIGRHVSFRIRYGDLCPRHDGAGCIRHSSENGPLELLGKQRSEDRDKASCERYRSSHRQTSFATQSVVCTYGNAIQSTGPHSW